MAKKTAWFRSTGRRVKAQFATPGGETESICIEVGKEPVEVAHGAAQAYFRGLDFVEELKRDGTVIEA